MSECGVGAPNHTNDVEQFHSSEEAPALKPQKVRNFRYKRTATFWAKTSCWVSQIIMKFMETIKKMKTNARPVRFKVNFNTF